MIWAVETGIRFGLSTSERMVLVVLSKRANGARVCWPSLPTIGRETGLSERQAQSVVHRLADAGLVRRELRGRSMHYYILRPCGHEAEPTPPEPEQAKPRQPLPDAVPVETPATIAASPRQPLPDDPGNLAQTTPATIATEIVQEEYYKPKTRVRAKAAEISGLKAAQPARAVPVGGSVPLAAVAMSADERANVTVCLGHLVRGDLAAGELASRLGFIRQRYPFAGFPWLVQHNPAAASIAAAQGWRG